MNCFESSRDLLLKIEQVVTETPKFGGGEGVNTAMHRFLFGPVGFLYMGLRAIFAPLAHWSVVTIALWPIFGVIGRHQAGIKDAAFLFSAFLAGGLVTFMLPSGCAVAGIKPRHVSLAKEAVIDAASSWAVRYLKDAVGVMRTRCEGRIKRLSWALGIAWAALLWAVVNMVLKPDLIATERNQSANELLPYVLVFVLAAVGFACYEAAVKVLFQTVDFAFIQASAELDSASG